MRLPLSDYVSNTRDERRHILFLGDLFTGTEDLLLTSLVKSLGEEYHCMYENFPKGPREAVRPVLVSQNISPSHATRRREQDNKELMHHNTEDMNAFNVIEYLKK